MCFFITLSYLGTPPLDSLAGERSATTENLGLALNGEVLYVYNYISIYTH